MSPKDILSLIQSGIFHTAEGIGNPAKLMRAISPQVSNLGSRVGQAMGRIPAATGNVLNSLKQSAQHAANNTFVGSSFFPKGTGPGTSLASRAAGAFNQRFTQHLQNRGLQGITPQQYLKIILGAAGKDALKLGGLVGKGAGGLAGLSSKALMGGISSGGSALQGGLTGAMTKLTRMFGALSSSHGGLAQTIFMLSTMGKAGLLAAIPVAIKAFVARILDSNRALSKFNGSIAASFARLDIARLRSDIATAAGTKGTATELNRQMIELTKEFQPIRQQIGIGVNLLGIGLVRIGRDLIVMRKALVESIPWLKAIADRIAKEEEKLAKGQQDAGLGNQILTALTKPGRSGAPMLLEPGGLPPRAFVGGQKIRPGWWDRRGRGRGRP